MFSLFLAMTFVMSMTGVVGIALAGDKSAGAADKAEEAVPAETPAEAEAPAEEPEDPPAEEPAEEAPAPEVTIEPVDEPVAPEEPAAPDVTFEEPEPSTEAAPVTVAADAPLVAAVKPGGDGVNATLTFMGYKRDHPAGWTTGNLGERQEGELVPHRLIIDNRNNPEAILPEIAITYDHFRALTDAVFYDFTQDWGVYFPPGAPAGGDSPSVPAFDIDLTGVSGFVQDAGAQGVAEQLTTTIPAGTITVPAGGYAVVYFRAHLALTVEWRYLKTPARDGAGPWSPGSPSHTWLAMEGVGAKKVPIPAVDLPQGSISVMKFEDIDGDGIPDAGETPLGEWDFTLDADVMGVQFQLAETTGPDGKFLIEGLPPGDFVLSETLKPDWEHTGASRMSDAGAWVPVGLLPYAFSIVDGEAVEIAVGNNSTIPKDFEFTFDGGPYPGVLGPYVRYDVTSPDGGVDLDVETDLGGSPPYSAATAFPLNSILRDIEWRATWSFAGYDEDLLLDFDPGPEVLDDHYFNTGSYGASLVGEKVIDVDGDGVEDPGEAAIDVPEPFTIKLMREMAPDVWVEYAQTQSDVPSGDFSFSGVLPGTYRVTEEVPAGYIATQGTSSEIVIQSSGQYEAPDPILNAPSVDKYFELTLDDPIPDAGFWVSFWSQYGDGDPEYHEIDLVDDGSGTIFVGDPFEVWPQTVISGVTWMSTWNGIDIELGAGLEEEVIVEETWNRFRYGAEISGAKFKDEKPYDGAWQPNDELGLDGWTIRLQRWDGQDWDDYAETVTAGGGLYGFVGLLPGEYRVVEVQQDGWVAVAWPDPFPIGNGDALTGLDFGNRMRDKTFELYMWHPNDLPADLGVSQYYVSYLADGVPMTTALTLAWGDDFLTMFAGDEEFADGTVLSAIEWFAVLGPVWGNEIVKLGDGVSVEVLTDDMVNVFEFDNHIYGTKYLDEDGDGDLAGEIGLDGWTIELYRMNEGGQWQFVASDVTGPDNLFYLLTGAYEFLTPLPGSYSLVEVEQAGYVKTAGPTNGGDSFVVGNWSQYGPFDFGNAPDIQKEFVLTLDDPIPNTTFYVEFDKTYDGQTTDERVDLSGSGTSFSGVYGDDPDEELWPQTELTDVTWYAVWSGQVPSGPAVEVTVSLGVDPEYELLTASMTNPYRYGASIEGFKFDDVLGDGDWDSGDTGLAGWTIELERWIPGYDEWASYDSTTTDQDGLYWFDGLLPGTYRVAEVMQPGWAQTHAPYPFTVMTDGSIESDNETLDFFNRKGYKTFEFEFLGDLDGIPGDMKDFYVVFDAQYPDGSSADDVVWVLSGGNPFTTGARLPLGTVLTDIEWSGTYDPPGSAGDESLLFDFQTGPEQIAELTENRGSFMPAIFGYKRNDVTQEQMAGWTIELYRMDDGQWELYDTQDTHQIGNDPGYYTFQNLVPGDYYVVEVGKPDWVQTTGPSGSGDAFTVSWDDAWHGNIVFGNTELVDKDFLLTMTNGDPERDDLMFHADFKVDGIQQPTVDLVRDGGQSPDADYTGEGGSFPQGSIITDVEWFAMWDWYPGQEPEIRIDLGSDPGPEELTDDLLNEFVYDGELDGYKYDDANGDGARDGDAPLQDWTIQLYRYTGISQVEEVAPNADVAFDTILFGTEWVLWDSADTNAQGLAEFHAVPPGTYYMQEVQQWDWGQTYGPPTQFVAPMQSGEPTDTISVFDGYSDNREFGNRQPVKTFELTYEGEVPEYERLFVRYDVGGWFIEGGDAVVFWDDWGRELDLEPMGDGKFAASETMGPNWTIYNVHWIIVVDGVEYELGVTEGETLGTADVTNPHTYDPPRIFGYKWDDTDPDTLVDADIGAWGLGDGVWDDGEPGLGDWVIELYRIEDEEVLSLVATTTTDPDGYYEFADLLPGDYYLDEVLQLGWTQSARPQDVVSVEDGDDSGAHDFGNWELVFRQIDLVLEKDVEADVVQVQRTDPDGRTLVEQEVYLDYTITYWNEEGLAAAGQDYFFIADDFASDYLEVVDAGGGDVSGGTITWDLNTTHPTGLKGVTDLGGKTYTLEYRLRVKNPDTWIDDARFFDNFAEIRHTGEEEGLVNSPFDPLAPPPARLRNQGDLLFPVDNNLDSASVPVLYLPFTGGAALVLLLGGLAGLTGAAIKLRRRED